MKKILLILALVPALTFAQPKERPWQHQPAKPVTYDAVITRVIDGDTVAFEAKWLPDPLKKELSIRVYGVDTPEKSFRAKCDKEAKMGEAATAFTKDMIKNSRVRKITLIDWDKYGGRVLGDVVLDGQSLRAALIQKGFAREYYGDAKTSWCE